MMGFHGLQNADEGNFNDRPRNLSPPLLSTASGEGPRMALSPGKRHPHQPSLERGSNVDLSKTFNLTPHGTWSFGGNDAKRRKTHYGLNLDGSPDSPDVAPPYSKSPRPHEQSLSPRSSSPEKMSDSGYFTRTDGSTPFTSAPESQAQQSKPVSQSLPLTDGSATSSEESDQNQGGAILCSPKKGALVRTFRLGALPEKTHTGITPTDGNHPQNMAEHTAETEQGTQGMAVQHNDREAFKKEVSNRYQGAPFDFSNAAKERVLFFHGEGKRLALWEARSAVCNYHKILAHDYHKKIFYHIDIRVKEVIARVQERARPKMGEAMESGQE